MSAGISDVCPAQSVGVLTPRSDQSRLRLNLRSVNLCSLSSIVLRVKESQSWQEYVNGQP